MVQDEAAGESGAGTGKVYLVYGPLGGAGKTTTAINLALAFAQQQLDRVALFDLDLAFGHVAPALGPSPSTSLASLLPDSLRNLDRKHLNRWLLTRSSTRRVLVGANTPGEGEAATGEHVRAALARGRYPRRLFELAANSLRLYANALAYACLLADAFASFKRQRGFAKGRLITQQGGAPISKALAGIARDLQQRAAEVRVGVRSLPADDHCSWPQLGFTAAWRRIASPPTGTT